MKKVIRLTESDLTRIVKRVLMEQGQSDPTACFKAAFEIENMDIEIPKSCMEVLTNPSLATMAACSWDALVMAPKIGLPTDPSEIEEKVQRFYECATSKVKY
jgi:hypothetical protein